MRFILPNDGVALALIAVGVMGASLASGAELAQPLLFEDGGEAEHFVTPVQFQDPVGPPMEPVAPDGRDRAENNAERNITDHRINDLFGSVDDLGGLSLERLKRAGSPAADAVFGSQATGRHTNDAGDLLKKSFSTHGVATQNRTPLVSETRVRGQRVGQVLASGSYWAPARMDLDTMLNKLDSRLISDMILIKGPYSPRYGPGFRFVDLEFIQSPRYENGFESHGSTSASYRDNGQQFYGRQEFSGGAEDYGFLVSYGHRTGNDYETGQNGFYLPTSYKSRDLFVALGYDLSRHQKVEFNYLRLDQTDVEFPGLVFDLNYLVTDGFEVTYTDSCPSFADHFTAEYWYNRTRFEGDTLRPGKNRQLPFLIFDLYSPSGIDGFAVTDGDGLSAGQRLESTYDLEDGHVAFGTDLIVLNQELNDIEPLDDPTDNNFPIPRSHSVDVGCYAERVRTCGRLTTTAGLRWDAVVTNARNRVEGVADDVSEILDADLQQSFIMGSAYVTAAYEIDPHHTADIGVGYAQRPPTLTEMYAINSFIGSLQRGQTFLAGDPLLNPEKLIQLDVGLRADCGYYRYGVHGYQAWILDYLTYDLFSPAMGDFGFPQGAALVNTELATLQGFELYGQYDLSDYLTAFGVMSYVRGTDHTRSGAARLFGGGDDRSGVTLPKEEALPGITPLETRLGFLLQDPSPEQRWGLELSSRLVDDQHRIAATLEEIATPGFTTYDMRYYVRSGHWLLTAGVENLTNKFYREHIDYRSGLGVYRPGRTIYTGLECTY